MGYNDSRNKILNLENRRHVYDTIVTYAGTHFRDIVKKSKLAVGTVRHHITILKKEKLIIEKRDNNHLIYFPREIEIKNKELLILLRQKILRDILLQIYINKRINHEILSQELELSSSTLSWNLKKLIDKGIIEIERKGRKSYFTIKIDENELKILLIKYKESFLDTLVNRVITMWDN